MPEPAGNMIFRRIVMRPVNDAAFRVPLVLSEKLDRVAHPQGGNRRRKVDVVRNQQRLPGRKPQYEALVPAAFIVIGEELDDLALAPDLKVALFVLECLRQRRVRAGSGVLQAIAQPQVIPCVLGEECNNDDRDELLH